MTMSKEMERLKSKFEFCEKLLYLYENSKLVFNSIKFDKEIEHYQNELSKIYKIIQELKEEVNK